MGRKRPPVVKYATGELAYRISFTYKGVSCRETLKYTVSKSNDKLVHNLLGEIKNRIAVGNFNYSDYFPNSDRCQLFSSFITQETLNQAGNRWLKGAETKYPHSTYRTYRKDLYIVLEDLGDHKVAELSETPRPILDWARKQKTTLKTVKNKLCPIRGVFKMVAAETNGKIRNPLDGLDIASFTDNVKQSSYELDPYNLDEIQSILSVCNDQEYDYWAFAFFTGLRTGEQYGLKWEDNLHIQRTITERKEKNSPKTKASYRTLDLVPMAKAAYERQKTRSYLKSDYVFICPATDNHYYDYDETGNMLKRLCKLAKVRYRNQYQTRHAFASNMLSGGENLLWVSEQMGHASPKITLDKYSRFIKAESYKFKSDFAAILPLHKTSN